jgi:predicted lipoprotein with Yx(FWY)xxD motif/plastocyanin
MHKIKSGLIYLAITMVIITSLFITTGCSKVSSTTTSSAVQTTTTTTPATSQATYTVNTSNKTGLGTYLTDSKGMTLYWTNRDTVGQSNITGTTLANWPAFYTATILVPSSLNAGDFSSITRADGTKQTTFKGWPLYYFIKDIAPSDTSGQGLAGVWFVAVPTSSAPPPATTTMTMATMTTTTATSVTATTSTTAANTTTTSSTVAGTPVTISLTAQNVAFDKSTITVSAGAAVTINFNNKDSVPHNFALYTNSSATPPAIFAGQVVTGPTTITYTFTAPTTPGTYFFRCDIHPSIMTGSFIVQ